jgi:ketosteroid isomerase-like protein
MTVQEFTITSLEVDGYDDLAFDRGTWTSTYVIEGMAEDIAMTGSYIAIARKQADGSWLWASVISGTDAPMPPQFQQPQE